MSLMGKLFGDKGDGKGKRDSARKQSGRTRVSSQKKAAAKPRSSVRKAPTSGRMPKAMPSSQNAAAAPINAKTITGSAAAAAASKSSTQHSSRRRRTSMKGKQIGSLLQKKDIITQEQLDKALSIQEQKGGLLGQILTELEYCKKADIGAILKKQRTITTVLPESIRFEAEATSLLTRDFCETHRLIAFEKIGNTLCVAMANVLDAQAKNEIKEKLQLQIKTFDAGWPEIKDAIDREMKDKPEEASADIPHISEDDEELVIELPEEDLIEGSPALPQAQMSSQPIMTDEDEEMEIETISSDSLSLEDTEDEVVKTPRINERETVDMSAAMMAEVEESELPAALPIGEEEPLTIEADDLEITGQEEETVDHASLAAPVIEEETEDDVEVLVSDADLLEPEEISGIELEGDEEEREFIPLPDGVLQAIPLSRGYFGEVVQWGAADAERRWLAEHLADNILPVVPAPELREIAS